MNCEPCKESNCPPPNDFTYSIQGEDQSGFAEQTEGQCEPCRVAVCPTVEPDLPTYSLQSNLAFNTEPITVVVPCPPGWICHGSHTVTFPPGTVIIPDPNQTGGFVGQTCQGTITAATQEELLQLLAESIAYCNTVNNPPSGWEPPLEPPQQPPVTYANIAVNQNMGCDGAAGEFLIFTGTAPNWISINSGTFTVTALAGKFFSNNSQSEANHIAAISLGQWISTEMAAGRLQCQGPFLNTQQSYNCAEANSNGSFDENAFNLADDGSGIYVEDGTVFAKAGFFTSLISQADANAQAENACIAKYNQLVGSSIIECFNCALAEGSFTHESGSYTFDDATSGCAGSGSSDVNTRTGLTVHGEQETTPGAFFAKAGGGITIFNNSAKNKRLSLAIQYSLHISGLTSGLGFVRLTVNGTVRDQVGIGYTGTTNGNQSHGSIFERPGAGPAPVDDSGNETLTFDIFSTGGTLQCRRIDITCCILFRVAGAAGNTSNGTITIVPTWSDVPP